VKATSVLRPKTRASIRKNMMMRQKLLVIIKINNRL